MKMKFGAIVVDGRGKIGGHVASKNRSGAYLRTKVTPVNRNSDAQIAVRGRLTLISKAWRGLVADVILAWNAAVSDYKKTDIFGDIKNPTGFTLYQKLNNNSLRNGGAAIATPPLPVAVPYLTTFTPTAVHGGAVSIAFAVTPVPAGECYEIMATKALSAGISFVKSEFRIISHLAPAEATPYVATDDYNDVFGTVGAAGQKIFFQVRVCKLATGQMGAPIQAVAVIS
jgi:hypothetical protein